MSTAQLDAAIATTASNGNSYPERTGGFSDPPTQGELEAFTGWANGLRAALVRV